MSSIFPNKNGWPRRTVSTDFYLFVASHDPRALWLIVLNLLLGESYLPEPWCVVFYLDETVLLDACHDRCQVSRCPLEVDEEDLEWPLSLVIGLVKHRHALDLVVVDDIVEDLANLLRRAAVKSIADAERRNSGSGSHGGRHC